jgi:hypothetical protein
MKGQSATEYLMTYGWAILAIAIVGALLYTQVFSERVELNTQKDRMDIGAVNKCMMNCNFVYNDETNHNYLIPISENIDKGVEMMTNSGVSQDIIDEYEKTCEELRNEAPQPTKYQLCIRACFE